MEEINRKWLQLVASKYLLKLTFGDIIPKQPMRPLVNADSVKCGGAFAMSDQTRERLDAFWELIDEILNAVLFMLIGLDLVVITLQPSYFVAGLIATAVSRLGRLISVGLPIGFI